MTQTKQPLVLSSANTIAIFDEFWTQMVTLVKDDWMPSLGRGCVFYDKAKEVFGYVPFTAIQSGTPEELELQQDIYDQLLAIVGYEYDLESEFVLLIKVENESIIKFDLTIALLDYNGRKGVFSDEYIKNVEREKQIEQAREEKFKLQLDRLGKKKKKNKKIRKTFYEI